MRATAEWAADNLARIFVITGAIALIIIAFAKTSAVNVTASTTEFWKINQSSQMTKGNANAKVAFVQYSDFLCPSCSYVSTRVVPHIEQESINNGAVQFEFRPMAFIAEGSVIAGAGAYCAVDQGKFWQYHDAIYAFVADRIFNQNMDPKRDTILTAQTVKSIAGGAGLTQNEFDDCLSSDKHLADIQQSTARANKNGITGTPYLLINGTPLTNNPNLDTVRAMIKANL